MSRSRRSKGVRGNNDYSNRRLQSRSQDPSKYRWEPSRYVTDDYYRRLGDWLRGAEDQRRWDPEGPGRPYRATDGRVARVGVSEPVTRRRDDSGDRRIREQVRSATFGREKLGFFHPDRIAICVRRKVRREVLHALGLKRGLGSGGSSKWTDRSKIKC